MACLWLFGFMGPSNIHTSTANIFTSQSFCRGGYQAGSASSSDGDDLIRQAGGGAVVVLIQYRLGVLGFLPGKQVHDGGSLNVGLRELWISSFGILLTNYLQSTNNLLFSGCKAM